MGGVSIKRKKSREPRKVGSVRTCDVKTRGGGFGTLHTPWIAKKTILEVGGEDRTAEGMGFFPNGTSRSAGKGTCFPKEGGESLIKILPLKDKSPEPPDVGGRLDEEKTDSTRVGIKNYFSGGLPKNHKPGKRI